MRKRAIQLFAVAAAALAVLCLIADNPALGSPPGDWIGFERWVESVSKSLPVVAPLITILVAIFPIPAEIPAAVNGMIFGPIVGTLITWSGALVGAAISYEIACRYGRPVVRRVLSEDRLEQAERVADQAGAAGLLALRLLPIVAFTLLNWGAGLVRVPRKTFLWTTAVGILPGAIVFTASGSGLLFLYRQYPGVFAVLITLASILLIWALWKTVKRPRSA